MRVLVLNAESDLPPLIADLLPHPETMTLCVQTPAEGIPKLNARPFFLIVVDGRTAFSESLQLVRQIRRSEGGDTVPIILIHAASPDWSQLSELDDVDTVPLVHGLLRQRIGQYSRIQEQQREVEIHRAQVYEVQEKLEREIKYHKETERILSENERTLRSIFHSIEATGESILLTDKSQTVYYANPAFYNLTGFEAEEVFGATVEQFINLKDAPISLKEMKTIALESGYWHGDVTLARSDGSLYDAFLDINSVKGKKDEFEGFIFIQRDITTMKRVMHELERLARVDYLTGLYNRRYFFERLRDERRRGRRYNHPISLIILDLDFFKQVNDTYGHQMGDRVLERTGNLVARMMRQTDFAGRYGGEELCIALPETTLEGGRIFAERLRIRLENEVFRLPDGSHFQVTCSIGLTRIDPEDETVEVSFNRADEALYRAKRQGRNRVEVAA